jgi:hypothetical protein
MSNKLDITYTKRELQNMETIEQAWDGDELKVEDGDIKVWLTSPENRQYNGDYTVETRINGSWYQENKIFE